MELKKLKNVINKFKPSLVMVGKQIEILSNGLSADEKVLYAATTTTKESRTGLGVVCLTDSRIVFAFQGHASADLCLGIDIGTLSTVTYDSIKKISISTAKGNEIIDFVFPAAANNFYEMMSSFCSLDKAKHEKQGDETQKEICIGNNIAFIKDKNVEIDSKGKNSKSLTFISILLIAIIVFYMQSSNEDTSVVVN